MEETPSEDPGVARDAAAQGEGLPVIKIRYRSGVVGETQRVVHAATFADESVITACALSIPVAQVERIEVGGMPCMQCAARIALATQPRLSRPDR